MNPRRCSVLPNRSIQTRSILDQNTRRTQILGVMSHQYHYNRHNPARYPADVATAPQALDTVSFLT